MHPNHRETAAAVLAGLREAHITTGAPHKLYTYALVGSGTPTGEIDAFDRELPPIPEQHFAELTGRAGALVAASESSALRLAMRGLGTGHDHEVAVPELGWVPGDIMSLYESVIFDFSGVLTTAWTTAYAPSPGPADSFEPIASWPSPSFPRSVSCART
ncbi:hypothetical protein [Streptomyces sp. NPDC088246]|uniref:hypothetical protein n=1 Tax=Streptomyces sp. NPDC088246 TaxID=3365842 RepID=UPI0037F409E0